MNFSRKRFLLLAFLIVLLVCGAFVLRSFLISTPPPEPAAPVQEEQRQMREVILYFGSGDGRYLEGEVRQIEDCFEEIECVAATVQALMDGPAGERIPVLPSQAVLRGVTTQEGVAILDFSREVVSGHPGGSMSELLSVYALANTVAANFPHVRQVQILVEGETVETLKGHVDLRRPVQADFGFSRSPSTGIDETVIELDQAAEEAR